MAVLLSDGEMKTRGYTETISRLITSAKMQAKMKYVLQLDCWTSSERVATCVSLLFFYLYNISFLSALFLFIPLLSTRSTTTNMICMKGCYTQIMVGILYYITYIGITDVSEDGNNR